MKKNIFGLLFSIALATSSYANTFNIAALINGDIISNEDLSDQINIFMLNSPVPYNEETQAMINHRVLAQTIEQKLKLQQEKISNMDKKLEQQKEINSNKM